MPRVYIGIGSNLGRREEQCMRAIGVMREKGLMVLRHSSLHETEPWGNENQPSFINAVVEVETGLKPIPLLALLKQIEHDMGRQHTVRWGPRMIDLDILFYDDLKMDEPGLSIPHPLMHERVFVLAPLAEIAPDLVHPVLLKTVRELLMAAGPLSIS